MDTQNKASDSNGKNTQPRNSQTITPAQQQSQLTEIKQQNAQMERRKSILDDYCEGDSTNIKKNENENNITETTPTGEQNQLNNASANNNNYMDSFSQRNKYDEFNKIFDLDWFDIQTKSRALISEILQPTIQKLHSQKDEQQQQSKIISTLQNQVKELEYAVFKKNQRLNVFEEIDTKISENERSRAENEAQIWQSIDGIEKQREEWLFEVENVKKRVKGLEEHKDLIYGELRRIQDNSEQTKEDFIMKLKENYTALLQSIEEQKKKLNTQEMNLNLTTSKTMSNTNYIKELQSRSDQFATNIQKCQKELTLLYELKQDKSIMEEIKDRMWAEIHKMQKELDEKTNQFNTVENFVEKYIPIRIQSQISETLACILNRAQLNKLENFEMEKFQQLNMVILEDDGSADLKQIMRELLKEVIREQEEEKNQLLKGGKAGGLRANRHQRFTSQGGTSQTSITQKSGSHTPDKTAGQTNKNANQDQSRESSNIKITDNLAGQIPKKQSQDIEQNADLSLNITSFSQQVQNLQNSQQRLGTEESAYLDMLEKEKQEFHKREMFELLVKLDFSEEISIKKLIDLPFKVTDQDEELALNQLNLIKLIKIILYKLGLTYKRQDYFKKEAIQETEEKMQQYKNQLKMSFNEMNEFIQTFHSEFSDYVQLQKKDRSDLKNEVRALYENVKEANQQLNIQRTCLDKTCMIISCTSEFINIENTLDSQIENDKNKYLELFKSLHDNMILMKQDISELQTNLAKASKKQQQTQNQHQNHSSTQQNKNQDQLKEQPNVQSNGQNSIIPTIDKLKTLSIHENQTNDVNQTSSLSSLPNVRYNNGQNITLIAASIFQILSQQQSEFFTHLSYRGYTLSRTQLLEMRQIILEKISETMKKTTFYKSIQPQKIFTDMYQFYTEAQSGFNMHANSSENIMMMQSQNHNNSLVNDSGVNLYQRDPPGMIDSFNRSTDALLISNNKQLNENSASSQQQYQQYIMASKTTLEKQTPSPFKANHLNQSFALGQISDSGRNQQNTLINNDSTIKSFASNQRNPLNKSNAGDISFELKQRYRSKSKNTTNLNQANINKLFKLDIQLAPNLINPSQLEQQQNLDHKSRNQQNSGVSVSQIIQRMDSNSIGQNKNTSLLMSGLPKQPYYIHQNQSQAQQQFMIGGQNFTSSNTSLLNNQQQAIQNRNQIKISNISGNTGVGRQQQTQNGGTLPQIKQNNLNL
eukprot:403358786